MAGTLTVVEGDAFEAALPLGEARLVYADPPYTHEDKHGYGVWPGAERLVSRMLELGADDAAFVLHTNWQNLEELLPVLSTLAPQRTTYYPGQPASYRLLCWVKPWRRGGRWPTVAWVTMWEPVVLFLGAGFKTPQGMCEADWICALRSEASLNGHATQKPDELLLWLFTRLLAGAEGRLAVDLFAGCGGAAIMAARMGLDAVAVERDPFYCGKILENAAAAPAQVPGWAPAVQTNAHGRPVWPTLGRVELSDLAGDLAALARQRKDAHVAAARPDVEAGPGEDGPVGEEQPETAEASPLVHLRGPAHNRDSAGRRGGT